MKEFQKTNTITYNLMSFTAFKSLMIFTLLLEAPKSFREIADFFKTHEYIKEDISADTFRVYLTSLKRSGCEIERIPAKGGSKYQIVSHPFELKISDAQVRSITKVYRIILRTIDLKGLFVFDKFVRKLAEETKNEKLSDTINRISVFKKVKPSLFEELCKCVQDKKLVTFVYHSPRSKNIQLRVAADKLDISHNKVYLYGTDSRSLQYRYYMLSRIIEISDIEANSESIEPADVITVKYLLKSLPPEYKLSNDEKIVEIREDSIIVEMTSSNRFILKQKIMEYGKYCTVLAPLDFRDDIIQTLKRMREGYENGC